MEHSPIKDFSFGALFPTNMVYMGYAMIFLGGIVGAVFHEWAGILVFIAGMWMSFSTSGTQLDLNKKCYREYIKNFGFKRGKWKSYSDHPDMALLKGKEGYTAYSRGMVELNVSETVYDIYLLNKDHRSKWILTRFNSKEEAMKRGPLLAEELGFRWTEYAPVVSEASRRRR